MCSDMQLDGQFANERFTGENDEQEVCPCGNAECKEFSFRSSLAQTAEAGIAGAAERQSGTQPLPAKLCADCKHELRSHSIEMPYECSECDCPSFSHVAPSNHQAVQDATTGEF